MNNDLIYGKNNTSGITCIEVQDNYAELFFQDKPSQIIPNKFWILANKPINNKFIELKGNLHYKYGIQFSKREDFQKYKSIWKKQKYDVYSIYDPKESTMVNRGFTYYKGMKLKDLSVLSFDIETTGLTHDENSKVLLISNTFRKNGVIERKLFAYDEHEDIFEAWSSWVRSIDPSIVICHNGYSFDLPYLDFCSSKLGSSLSIGKNGSSLHFDSYESKFRKDGSQFLHYKRPRIFGREIIDTYFLSIKYDFSRKYQSYGLKQIIKQEGLEQKDRVFYDASTIRDNYKDPIEWEKIKQYCISDSDDSLALFDLMAPSQFYWCQSVPKSFQSIIEGATGSQINSILVRSYLQDGHSLPKADPSKHFPGAISQGTPGIYKNVIKWDISSLYPSIILQYEVYDRKKDPKGHFLEMVKTFRDIRIINKKLSKQTKDPYYYDLEQSQKIAVNSSYGTLGAEGLLFNSPVNAEFITAKGQEILKHAIKWATNKDFEVKIELEE
jgi:DNA polymerase I